MCSVCPLCRLRLVCSSLLNGSSKVPTLVKQTPVAVQRHNVYLKPSSGHKVTGVHTEASSLPWLGAQIKKWRIKKKKKKSLPKPSWERHWLYVRQKKLTLVYARLCAGIHSNSLPSPAKQLWEHHLGTLPSESGYYVFAQILFPLSSGHSWFTILY